MPTTTERTKPKSQAGSGGGHRPLQRQLVDAKKYGRLLARSLPAVVETEAENDRLLGIVERLMGKGGAKYVGGGGQAPGTTQPAN